MGWRKVSTVLEGDAVIVDGRIGTVESKTPYPHTARGTADLLGYTLRVDDGAGVSQEHTYTLATKVLVVTK
jgi:hypothetical protein